MKFVPTLNFDGRCREALNAYEKAFGARVSCYISYRDANDPAYRLSEDKLDCAYHAEMLVGDNRVIMSDNFGLGRPGCEASFITVMCDSPDEVRRAYAVLKEGSTTIYPMEETQYSACRVVFTDKFGIRWGIMTE